MDTRVNLPITITCGNGDMAIAAAKNRIVMAKMNTKCPIGIAREKSIRLSDLEQLLVAFEITNPKSARVIAKIFNKVAEQMEADEGKV